MHELSIVARILDMALDVSRCNGDAPVERVCVDIGALRQAVPEVLSFAFGAASRGTAAESAVFAWSEIPAEIVCENCEANFSPQEFIWLCPECGLGGGRIVRGDELVLRSVTLRGQTAKA